MTTPGDPSADIDARRFVALSQGLRTAFSRLDTVLLLEQERSRWQRRLVGITETARRDLPRAQTELARYEDDWHRQIGNERPTSSRS